jgi:putative nucleotidyltransferase with HDIG domain
MEVLDITGKGFDDIKNKVLRVTDESAAELIFKQDPLRILRAVRQSLQLGFEIESKTFEAMKKTVDRISIVSPERIRDELIKILLCESASKAIEMMDEIALLEIILPEIKCLQNLKQPPQYHDDDVYRHTLKVLDRVAPSLVLRISALLHDAGKLRAFNDKEGRITFYGHEKYGVEIAERILSRLIFPRDFSDAVLCVIKNHIRPKNYISDWGDAAVRRLAFECGEHLDLIMDLGKADYGKDEPDMRVFELARRIEKLKKKDALNISKNFIDGLELMNFFNLPPGPWIKTAKDKINETLIENPRLSKQEVLEILKNFLQKPIS